jgi:hypothetical protein
MVMNSVDELRDRFTGQYEDPVDDAKKPVGEGNPNRILIAAGLGLLAAVSLGELFLAWQIRNLQHMEDRLQGHALERQQTFQIDMEQRFEDFARRSHRNMRDMQRDLAGTAEASDATASKLEKTRAMAQRLAAEQSKSNQEFGIQILGKADEQQVRALSKDVSSTRSDLEAAKKNLQDTTENMGKMRTELGTLIARNHDEVDQFRLRGERDYFEFTLERRESPIRVAGVGLRLKRVSLKRHRYTLEVYADDLKVEKKDRSINEPVYFYVSAHKGPLELVINKIGETRVAGYLSIPKELSQRGAGSR